MLPCALLGVSIGLLLSAVLSTLTPDPGLSRSALLTGLLTALAAGIAVPQRVAWWLAGRGGAEGVAGTGVALPEAAAQRVFFGVVVLAGGLAVAIAPVLCRVAGAVQVSLGERFLWTPTASACLYFATGLVVGLAPLSLLGMGAACAHRPVGAPGLWSSSGGGLLVAGCGVGAFGVGCLERMQMAPEIGMLAAALPALCVALLVAGVERGGAAAVRLSTELPLASDRRPRLMRWGLVLVACCAAWQLALSAPPVMSVPAGYVVPVGLGLLGLGWYGGDRLLDSRAVTIGAFGMAAAGAGACHAAALWSRTPPGEGGAWVSGWLAAGSLLLLGLALGRGHEVLLARVAHQSSEGSVVLGRCIVASSLTFALWAPLSVRLLGGTASGVACALAQLAFGGALIIHEPAYGPRARRNRLLFVFGSVAVMIGLAVC